MKKQILITLGTILISSVSLNVQAGWWSDAWDDTKETASSVWDKTKEKSASAWESVSDEASDVKESVTESSAGPIEEVKKLGDKETYIQAWEGIKESAKNPSAPDDDENGLPKE